VLALVYVVAYLDRQILAILLPPIKQEFALSDTELGLLAGPTFALFYATLGVPLARLADRFNRRNIIAAALALFSLATLACAAARSFVQLLLARVAAGVGEAGTGPAAQAMISDLYPPEARARAQAIYATGLNLGLMLAFFFGGMIAETHGWRAAFLVAGAPGLALAPLILIGLAEPKRGASEARADASAMPTSLQGAKFLWSQRAYRLIVSGTVMSAFAGYGILAFVPSFLVRSHNLALTDIGSFLAVVLGIGGGLATFLAGVMADRLAKRDIRWNMYVPALAVLFSLPFWPVFFFASETAIALLGAIVPASLASVYIGPCAAMLQGLAPLRLRAFAASLQLFFANLIGLGLGPLAIGLASDLLRPQLGEASLRYALLIGVIPALLSALCYWRAAATLGYELARAKSFEAAAAAPAPS